MCDDCNFPYSLCVKKKKCKHKEISTYLVIWTVIPRKNMYSDYTHKEARNPFNRLKMRYLRPDRVENSLSIIILRFNLPLYLLSLKTAV